MRMLALVFGGTADGSVYHARGVPAPVWGLLVLHVLVWPPITFWLMRRSADRVIVNRRCFLVDAAMVGVWIALMAFNMIPVVLLATMTAMTLVATEGPRLLLLGTAVLIAACGLAFLANGFVFVPHTETVELLASLPLMVVFPIAVGFATHGLAQRVRVQNRALVEMSSTDSLSGLSNRRYWEEVVNMLLAARQREPAVMLLLDIDNFKHVNDQYGHVVGDEVIRLVGGIIRESIRAGDVAGRYGGDEFGVVLRGVDTTTTAAGAEVVAQRIRARVAAMGIPGAPGLHCTLSIGIAAATPGVPDARAWVGAADSALYSAKLAGRNCVRVH
jgi:diguanylate cyclase